jgi:RHS repeat-associated protein
MEKDDEIKGSGNSYTTEFRQYDPRLGRRWRPDPLVRKYPSISSYAGLGNNPIYYVDEDGRDPRKAGEKITIDPTRMSVIKSSQVADNFNKKKYDKELYVNADKGFGVGLLNSIPILDQFVTKMAQKLNLAVPGLPKN